MGMKDVVRRLPIVGSLAVRGSGYLRRIGFTGSRDYWEQRYRVGGTSGGGSMHHLAQFKADTLNAFVAARGLQSVIEFGCGDGRQLELARYPRYVGLDVSPTAVKQCVERFPADPAKSFFAYDPTAFFDRAGVFRADLALSLDVIYHLVEDAVFETYMRHLLGAATRYVAIYSSDRDRRSAQPHVRHRNWSAWVAANARDFRVVERVPNPYKGNDPNSESFADFTFYERTA